MYPTGAPNQAGVYSGVLEQQDTKFGSDLDPQQPGVVPNGTPTAGNIGMYTATVPVNGGLSTGQILVFVAGTIFNSSGFNGVADPDKSTFDAIFTLTPFNVTFVDANGNTVTINGSGQMRTKIIEENSTPLPGQTSTSAGHAARMTGTAIVDAFEFTGINLQPQDLVQGRYSVSGFRQITTPLP